MPVAILLRCVSYCFLSCKAGAAGDPKKQMDISQWTYFGSTKTTRFEVYIFFTFFTSLAKERCGFGNPFIYRSWLRNPATLSFPSHEVGILPRSISFFLRAGWKKLIPVIVCEKCVPSHPKVYGAYLLVSPIKAAILGYPADKPRFWTHPSKSLQGGSLRCALDWEWLRLAGFLGQHCAGQLGELSHLAQALLFSSLDSQDDPPAFHPFLQQDHVLLLACRPRRAAEFLIATRNLNETMSFSRWLV